METRETDTVSVSTDDFHYEDRSTFRFPTGYFFENKGIWVNAHDDFEILYVETGRIRLYVEDTLLILRAGEATVINSRCVHFGFLDRGTRHWAFCCRDQFVFPVAADADMQVFARIARGELHFCRRILTEETDASVLALIRRLVNVYRNEEPLWRLEATSLFFLLVRECLKSGFLSAECEQPSLHTDVRKNDISLYLEFARYVSRSYAEDITVQSTAAVLGISESKLYKVCRTVQGKTPVAYILDYRLDRALILLRTGEHSVTEAAYACGFGSVSYFIARFWEKYGMTPKQFCAICTEK